LFVKRFFEKNGGDFLFSQESTRKLLQIALWALVLGVCVFLFFRFLFGAVLPFLLAYLIAFCLQPLCRAMEKRAGISRKVTVLFAVCAIVALLLFLLVLLFRRLFSELSTLAGALGEFLTRLREDEVFRGDMAERLGQYLPFPEAKEKLAVFLSDLEGRLMDFLGNAAEQLSGSVLPFLTSLAAFLPGFLLSVLVVLIASYYFAIDFKGINSRMMGFLPETWQETLRKGKRMMLDTGGKFLRAYGFLLLVTFFELFAAFLILGLRYAFLLAGLISLIDILPVLGTGTVLIPWGAFCLLTGDVYHGVGLLIVYAVITVVRQVIEPKVVGKYIGLPPLASLASMYIGLKLFGFWGLFLLPLGATLLFRLRKPAKHKEKLP
jgi:sporulation integral membrane protein YtvI